MIKAMGDLETRDAALGFDHMRAAGRAMAALSLDYPRAAGRARAGSGR